MSRGLLDLVMANFFNCNHLPRKNVVVRTV